MLPRGLSHGRNLCVWVPRRFLRVLDAHKEFAPITAESPSADFITGTDPAFSLPPSFPVNVWESFISQEEEETLMRVLDPQLQKRDYATSHFDSVICNFRETLLPMYAICADPDLKQIVNRVEQQICNEGTKLEDAHVLDISENGFIAPHVDTEFTGGIVAGLTLLSDAVITFQPHNTKLQESLLQETSKEQSTTSTSKLALNKSITFPQLPRIDLFVPARSLYIITKEARYDWTHAIEVQANHTFKGRKIPRTRRVSLMFRDELSQSSTTPNRSGSLADFM